MKIVLIVFTLASALALETFTETRKVKDAAGKTRTCTYTIKYNAATKTVNKSKSKVACKPNTRGKQTVEKFLIPALGGEVTVTYIPRPSKTDIKKVTFTAMATTTEAPTTGETPVAMGGSAMHDCTCKPKINKTMIEAMMADGSTPMMGRAIRYLKTVDERRGGLVSLAPLPTKRSTKAASSRGGGGGGLFSSFRQAIINAIINALVGNLLGRSLHPADRQLWNGGFGDFNLNTACGGFLQPPCTEAVAPTQAPAPSNPFLSLLGGAAGSSDSSPLLGLLGGSGSDGGNDIMTQIAMQMAQQQLEEFINNGGMEDLISSQMEEAAAMMENGEMEAMVSQMMSEMDMEGIMAEVEAEIADSEAEMNAAWEEMMDSMDMTSMFEEIMGEEAMAMGMNMMKPEPEALMEMVDMLEVKLECSCMHV